MPYEAPTVGQVKGRFSEFKDVPDALIQMIIDETSMFVGTNWLESDYQPARVYLTAHMLHQGGALSGGTQTTVDPNNVSSITVGDVRVSMGGTDRRTSRAEAAGSDEELSRTSYGRMFLAIRKRNIPSVAVTS